jgi:FG-GAP-like repeat
MRTFSALLRMLALPLLLGSSAYAQTPAPIRFYGGTLPTGDNGAGATALADMNRDGKVDYLTVNYADRSVSVRYGNGAGSFTRAASADSLGRYPVRLQVADVNGDGWQDIVTLNPTSNTLSVRLNNGAGRYRGFELSFPYYYARDLYIADVTRDGIPDYVVMHWSSQIEVYPGDGTGRFTYSWPGLSTYFNNGAFELYPADVNNDGKLDMVGSGFNELQIRLGNGDGTFGNIISTPNPSTPASEVRVGDINNDGRPDLLAVDYNRNTVYIHLQTAAGGFVAGDTVTTLISPYPLRLADLNNDGKLDLVAGTDDTGWPGQTAVGQAEIRYGTGTGSFGPSEIVPLGNETSSDLIVGDVNQDGRLDFITCNYDNTYSVRVNSKLPVQVKLGYTIPYSYLNGLSQLHWKPGSATDRVVFIREVRPGRAPLAEPVDGVAYLANTQDMTPASRVAGGTYTLGPGPAGDSLAYLRNGAIGHVYEAAVYEFTTDPISGPIYRRDNSTRITFTTARFAPSLKASLVNGIPSLNWSISAQYKALAFQVQKSTDGGQTYTDEGVPVAALDSAAGTKSYSQLGTGPLPTRTFYRVQLTHADGTVLYSNAVPLGSVPLPVELVSFTGKLRPDGLAQLSWATAQEKNSAYFELQRSLDGRSFEPVARITAAGNSTQRRDYSQTDPRVLSRATYYRLRQVDLDTSAQYSSIVVLSPTGTPQALTCWPNPAAVGEPSALRLSGLTDFSKPVRFTVRSATSAQLVREQLLPAASTVEYALPASGLTPGVYLVEAVAAEGRWHSKLLVR